MCIRVQMCYCVFVLKTIRHDNKSSKQILVAAYNSPEYCATGHPAIHTKHTHSSYHHCYPVIFLEIGMCTSLLSASSISGINLEFEVFWIHSSV